MPANLRPEHWIALSIPASYVALLVLERLAPARGWPPHRHWEILGLLGFAALGAVNGYVSMALGTVLPQRSLVDGASIGTGPGILLGFLALSYGNAWLHRAYHRHDWLWRRVHRLHHAPARMGVAGVMYQTPFEMAFNAVLFVGVTRALFGLDPVATMACAWLASFYGMFQHSNIATPRWLGYVIQRPEAHCEHHRRGVHAGNYSDFPLWDLAWGTHANPARFDGELGFDAPRS